MVPCVLCCIFPHSQLDAAACLENSGDNMCCVCLFCLAQAREHCMLSFLYYWLSSSRLHCTDRSGHVIFSNEGVSSG